MNKNNFQEEVGMATGLLCEGCDHEFLPGELMLMAYEDEHTGSIVAFCCDCLAEELAVETAIPEDFCKNYKNNF